MPAPKPKKASGANVGEWQRSTEAIKLRLPADVAATIRERAAAEELSLADYVTRLVRTDAQIR